jgi:hypothetical protein
MRPHLAVAIEDADVRGLGVQVDSAALRVPFVVESQVVGRHGDPEAR